jgi:two-component system response regulator MprA
MSETGGGGDVSGTGGAVRTGLAVDGPVPPAMMESMLVLVVEDDPAVRASLERSLSFEGYQVITAPDGPAGLEAVGNRRPDAVLLDLGLPRMDGLEVCRRMRAAGDATPVLMLTAREATRDRVTGLDAGADDYLPKPFALEELLARLRALLRRSAVTASAARSAAAAAVAAGGERADGDSASSGAGSGRSTSAASPHDGELAFEDLRLEVSAREVHRGAREIPLTRTEFDLLELFLRHPRQVLTRAQILREVWGFDFDPGSNALEVYVGYLRRKLEEGGASRLLQTVRGVGYVLRPSRAGE